MRSLLDPVGKRRLIGSLVREALKRRTSIVPLVVVIEDLHWRDASSSDVLTDTSSAIAPLRCLFVSTSREAADITGRQGHRARRAARRRVTRAHRPLSTVTLDEKTRD